MARINRLVDPGVYEEVTEAIEPFDRSEYVAGEHMSTLVCTPMDRAKVDER